MYDAIAAYKDIFLYFSLSILAIGIGLGIGIALLHRYYRFVTGKANIFVHRAILQTYVEHYSHQAFPSEKPTVKICLNRRNQITIILGLLKPIDNYEVFKQIEKNLSDLFSYYLGYQNPLFLEITYKQ